MFESLSPLIRSILNAILIGLGGFLAAYLVYKLFTVLFSRLTGKSWARFIGNLLALGIVIWTISLILDGTGAVGVVVILATALTGALSLGSEHIASDLVSGVKLFTTHPFHTGDIVSTAEHTGKVLDISLMHTILMGTAGDRIIIRNSDVVEGTITNHSIHPVHRVEVQVSVPVSQDLEKVIAAIQEGLKDFSAQSSAEDAYKPGVVCETVSDEVMNVLVYAFIGEQPDHDSEKTRLMITTLQALKRNNIHLSDSSD